MSQFRLHSRGVVIRLVSLALLAGPISARWACAVDQDSHAPAQHHKSHKKALSPLVLPPLPAGPLAQVPMDQLPAAPPRVTYADGLLSIGAQNATLADVLKEVRRVTGATIDIPPAGANERIVVQLGPGTPRDVLAMLLNGTSFNYVMLGTASNPAAVSELVLTSRPSAGGGIQTAANMPAPVVDTPTPFQQQQAPVPGGFRMPQQMRRGPGMDQNQPPHAAAAAADDDSSDDSDADDKDDDDSDQPAQAVQPNLQQSSDSDQGNQPNAGPKTPEQILQMLRDRQQPGALQQPQQPPQD